MKARTSFAKRCLAFALAVVLLASGTNLGGILKANAADSDEVTVQIGEIVANNYALTDAEKALLSSGNLAGGAYSYTEPGYDLVTVDTDDKTITAAGHEDWVATQAKIMVNGEAAETIDLIDGVGTYTYEGNTFSVEVAYVLNINVDAATQETLLNTAGWLKNGVANTDAVAAQSGNLFIVETALPTLVDVANNGINFNGFTIELEHEGARNAISALDEQAKANGGEKLDLSLMIAEYEGGSKTSYLLSNGEAMLEEVKVLADHTAQLDEWLSGLAGLLNYLDENTKKQLKQLNGILGNLSEALKEVAEADWTAAEKGTALVAETADYAALDTLVAALGEITAAPAAENPLRVADKAVQVNMNMYNVTVKVVLNVVENVVGSDNLVTGKEAPEVVLTLTDGATKADIEAAVAAAGIEADALAQWTDVYVAEHFVASASALPETLTEDVTYTITYAPKTYTLTLGYADAMTVHYGYQYQLPRHANAEQAYDYTVNGTAYAQGEIVTVKGNTDVTRAAGKSYVSADLYTVVANNFGNDVAYAILTSGALKDNVTIKYRKPDPADAERLLALEGDILSAKNYESDYEGLSWIPSTYGANGNENTFSGNTASWADKSAKVQYVLALTNFGQVKAQEVLDMAATLKTEFAAQKGAMDSLAGLESTLVQLDKTKLGALNGVIDVTDFTEGDGTDTDAENLALRAELKAIVSAIIANNLDSNNYLKIYNKVVAYNNDGMAYYYKNYDAVKAEVNSLSDYLSNLMDKEDALRIMCNAAGYGEYADKIADIETKLNDYNSRLSAPNAVIDVNSENLGKLITALSAEGDAASVATSSPYILSEMLTAQDESTRNVQVIVATPNGNATLTTPSMDRGTILDETVINTLKSQVEAKVHELLGGNNKYYNETVTASLDALVGTELNDNVNIYYTYEAKTYTVKIDGEADQIVSIADLEINLPVHPTSGYAYKYIVDGVEGITSTTYTFTLEQIDRLFVEGTYTITRVEINEAGEKLEGTFADWIVKDEYGNVIGLKAEVDGNKAGLTGFAMTLVNSGYTYIGLNNEDLMYMNDADTLEVCLQTLINAILHDNNFGSQTLIDLGTNGKGTLLKADIKLGNSKEDIHYEALDFELYLNSVPGTMSTVADGLKSIKPYMTFKSNNGVMDVMVDLPDTVYAAYLTAALATGNVDKTDITTLNSDIAGQFLYDYVDLILNTDADAETFTNTLAKLGQNYDLTDYDKYYQLVKKVLLNDGVKINEVEDEVFDISVTGKSQKAINALISMLGIDVGPYQTYLAMIKEYKYEDAELTGACNAILVDTNNDVEALIVDLNSASKKHIYETTTDLPARLDEAVNNVAVILLGDVDGDLVFPGNAILDLNGFDVNGSITGKSGERLIIVDSCLETKTEGTVTGSVTNATAILGGTYNADVSSALKSGYKQVNGTVQNALFTVEKDGDTYTYVLNTEFINDESINGKTNFAVALGIDIAVDLALNYYTAAALSVDGNGLYSINFEKLIDMISGDNTVENVIDTTLACFDVPGIGNVAETIANDLLDFATIHNGLMNDSAVADYEITTNPWEVKVSHVTDGDFIDFGFGANEANDKTFTVAIAFGGDNEYLDYAEKLTGELAEIVVADETKVSIDLEQPVYDNKKVSASGEFGATAVVDMSENEDYATILGVILAYGNSAKRADVAAAVNAGDMVALKTVVDNTTVAELFTALKVMARNVDFAAMATEVGVTIDVTSAADLEAVYHVILCGVGKALEELDITGMNSKFGNLYNEQTGYYELSKTDVYRDGEISKRGFTAYAEATLTELSLKVKLFGEEPVEEDCLWGDADHENGVDEYDAALVLQYYVGIIDENQFFCTERTDVNDDGAIDEYDAALILQYFVGNITKFPVEE